MQYFVGDFDGTTFRADNILGEYTPPAGELYAGFEDATFGAVDDDGQCVRERSRRGQRPPAGRRQRLPRQRARQLLPRRGPGHGHADLAGVHDHPPVPELPRGRRQSSARPGARATRRRRPASCSPTSRARPTARAGPRPARSPARRRPPGRSATSSPSAATRGASWSTRSSTTTTGHGPHHLTRVHDHDRLHQLPDRWRAPPVSGRRRQPADRGQPDRRRKRRPHGDGPGQRGPQLGQLERRRVRGPDRPHRHRGREHRRLGAHQRRPVHVRGCSPPSRARPRPPSTCSSTARSCAPRPGRTARRSTGRAGTCAT